METMAHRARYAAAMTAITRRLPFGLSEVIEPNMLGYLLINLCTFFIDLSILALLHGKERWPIRSRSPCSYGTASLLSYVLNRVLNFRSHADVGRQLPVFVAVSASNYLIFVLGLTDLLSVGRRLLRARPGPRRLLRGRLPLLHDALGRLPRRERPAREPTWRGSGGERRRGRRRPAADDGA